MRKLSEGQVALGGLALLAVWLWIGLPLLYRERQQAPQIGAYQQSERGLQHLNNGNRETETRSQALAIAPSAAREGGEHERKPETEEHGEEGTEYWPPFLGYRLKITDTLIAGFTGAPVLGYLAVVARHEASGHRC